MKVLVLRARTGHPSRNIWVLQVVCYLSADESGWIGDAAGLLAPRG